MVSSDVLIFVAAPARLQSVVGTMGAERLGSFKYPNEPMNGAFSDTWLLPLLATPGLVGGGGAGLTGRAPTRICCNARPV